MILCSPAVKRDRGGGRGGKGGAGEDRGLAFKNNLERRENWTNHL